MVIEVCFQGVEVPDTLVCLRFVVEVCGRGVRILVVVDVLRHLPDLGGFYMEEFATGA